MIKRETYIKKYRKSLTDQLIAKGKDTDYNRDLVDKCVAHEESILDLIEDIRTRGIIVTWETARGEERVGPNPSLKEKRDEIKSQLAILHHLDMENPERKEDPSDGYV